MKAATASARFEPLLDDAIAAIRRALTDVDPSATELTQADLAKSVLATWARVRQTESAQETTKFIMARSLAENRQELAEYIRLTMPDTAMAQTLRVQTALQLQSPVVPPGNGGE